MKIKLKECVQLVKDRTSIENVDLASYISTDNMLPNRKGVDFNKSSKPKAKTVLMYQKGDVLISNIRPYFKKIWMADRNGTRSGDILAFRVNKSGILQKYLYCILQSDIFFDYVMASAKGTKMPRGDKNAILDFEFEVPSIEKQKKVYKPILTIEKKINLNNKINTNLKLLKTAIFNDMFNSKLLNNLNGKLADIAKIQTGKRPISRSSTYNNENKYPIVGASKIMGYTNSYNIDDSIITTGRVGTHGIIQRFREPVWISDNSFIFTSHYEDYLYEILKNRINYTSLNRGSTQPLITQTDLKNIDIYVPTDEEHRQFKTLIYPITNIEFTLNNEQHKLFKIKNLLLNKFFNSSKLTN